MNDETTRPIYPDTEAQLDLLAQSHNVTRDPATEEAAFQRACALVAAAPTDDKAWARVADEVRAMGPTERVILWAKVTGDPGQGIGDYLTFMARARGAHKHLAPLILELFGRAL